MKRILRLLFTVSAFTMGLAMVSCSDNKMVGEWTLTCVEIPSLLPAKQTNKAVEFTSAGNCNFAGYVRYEYSDGRITLYDEDGDSQEAICTFDGDKLTIETDEMIETIYTLERK